MNRHGDLEIETDPVFQRRDWRAQRVGWWVLIVALIAALAGLFGQGPLAHARVRSSDARLEIAYDRIARHGADLEWVAVVAPTSGDSIVDLWISTDLLGGMMMRRIEPQPLEERAARDGVAYRFRIADAAHPATIVFHTEPIDLWSRSGWVRIVGGDSVHVRQYVLP
jgi:hypothetical protein